MAINYNGNSVSHLKFGSNYVATLNYDGVVVWAERVGAIQYNSGYPASIKLARVYRTASAEPSARSTIKQTVSGNLYNGDTLLGEFTAADYWTISPTSSTVTLSPTPGTEHTWNIFGANGLFAYPVATRTSRSLTVSGNGQGNIDVTYTKQTDGTSTTVSKFNASDSTTYSAWAGADISWKYSYVSVDRTATTLFKTLNKRWTYYPTVYSGTITKGTDAITIKGPYNTTPTSKSYVTFSEFTSSTSDKTIARLPLVSAGGTRTGTFLTSLSHLFIYKETGIKIIGTYSYGVSGTTSSFEVYLSSSASTNSFNIVNSSGGIVGTVTFTIGSTIGSGITWVKKNSSTLTSLNVLVTVTDVQVYAFNAANPYPVAVTPGTTTMTLTNNETITQYITYKGGTFSTSNADYSWSPATNNCTTLASGSDDAWGATSISDSASEDYAIDYGNSDASWETWNSYFNKPNTDYMDNYG